MAKLTLSVDEAIVSRAKRYAKQHGVSVSQMVEAYLASVSEPSAPALKELPPMLRSVRGLLRNGNLESYRKHLTKKYR